MIADRWWATEHPEVRRQRLAGCTSVRLEIPASWVSPGSWDGNTWVQTMMNPDHVALDPNTQQGLDRTISRKAVIQAKEYCRSKLAGRAHGFT